MKTKFTACVISLGGLSAIVVIALTSGNSELLSGATTGYAMMLFDILAMACLYQRISHQKSALSIGVVKFGVLIMAIYLALIEFRLDPIYFAGGALWALTMAIVYGLVWNQQRPPLRGANEI